MAAFPFHESGFWTDNEEIKLKPRLDKPESCWILQPKSGLFSPWRLFLPLPISHLYTWGKDSEQTFEGQPGCCFLGHSKGDPCRVMVHGFSIKDLDENVQP